MIHLPNNRDGNCLFRSCAYHLNICQRDLRYLVWNYMSRNPTINGTSIFEWIKISSGEDPTSYLDKLRNSGVMGSEIELNTITRLYGIDIVVMKLCQHGQLYEFTTYSSGIGDKIYLLFTGSKDSGHYEPIEP